jgi:hypothetical protein
MTPERFQQIEAVFDAAANAAPVERGAVLDVPEHRRRLALTGAERGAHAS